MYDIKTIHTSFDLDLFLGRLLALATAGNEDVLAGLLLLQLFQKRRGGDSPSCSGCLL